MLRYGLIIAFLLSIYLQYGDCSVAKPTCGGSTSSKDILLLMPEYPPRECNYRITATSSYVCQLRIDFKMTLAQPTVPRSDNNLRYIQCVDDYFEVNGMRFCGVETNQHIYVTFNRTAGIKDIDMRIVLASRSGYNDLPTPSWEMKVIQLECPVGASVRDFTVEAEEIPQARATIKDGYLVAPPGCLQYFPEPSGEFTSFNFNNGKGLYQGNLNYAICFRRDTSTRALALNNIFFRLGAEYPSADMDDYCYSHFRDSGNSEDYLLIPEAFLEQHDIRATYFCGASIQGDTIISSNPGPLSLVFNSDAIYKSGVEMGFAFNYNIMDYEGTKSLGFVELLGNIFNTLASNSGEDGQSAEEHSDAVAEGENPDGIEGEEENDLPSDFVIGAQKLVEAVENAVVKMLEKHLSPFGHGNNSTNLTGLEIDDLTLNALEGADLELALADGTGEAINGAEIVEGSKKDKLTEALENGYAKSLEEIMLSIAGQSKNGISIEIKKISAAGEDADGEGEGEVDNIPEAVEGVDVAGEIDNILEAVESAEIQKEINNIPTAVESAEVQGLETPLTSAFNVQSFGKPFTSVQSFGKPLTKGKKGKKLVNNEMPLGMLESLVSNKVKRVDNNEPLLQPNIMQFSNWQQAE